jgi:hypothetical protein
MIVLRHLPHTQLFGTEFAVYGIQLKDWLDQYRYPVHPYLIPVPILYRYTF